MSSESQERWTAAETWPLEQRASRRYLERALAAESEQERLWQERVEAVQALIDSQAEREKLEARLSSAEAYIPSRDYEDYRADADRAALSLVDSGEAQPDYAGFLRTMRDDASLSRTERLTLADALDAANSRVEEAEREVERQKDLRAEDVRLEREAQARAEEAERELAEVLEAEALARQKADERLAEREKLEAALNAYRDEVDWFNTKLTKAKARIRELEEAVELAGQWVADAADRGDQIAEADLAKIRAVHPGLSQATKREGP